MIRVLVAGTYPPVPTPSAAVTLDTVRALLADGADVEVVSWRPSAAHHLGSLGGVAAARTLARLRRHRHFDRLVMCCEPGLPFEAGVPRWRTRIALRALRRVLGRFPAVELVVGRGVDMSNWPLSSLAALAHAQVRPAPALSAAAMPGVTPYGPPEWMAGERVEHVMAVVERWSARVARALLGERVSVIGRPLRRVFGRLRYRTEPPPG